MTIPETWISQGLALSVSTIGYAAGAYLLAKASASGSIKYYVASNIIYVASNLLFSFVIAHRGLGAGIAVSSACCIVLACLNQWAFLRQPPTLWTWVGVVLCILAISIIQVGETR